MKIIDYQKQAKRTFVNLDSKAKNDLHMASGILTEIGEIQDIFKKKLAYNKEIDLVNLGEEAADVAWYLVNKAFLVNIELEEFTIEEANKMIKPQTDGEMFKDMNDDERDLSFCMSLCLHLSASLIEPKAGLEDPQAALIALAVICDTYGIDFFEQLDKNINKLKVRFPDKFDENLAINRNTDEERKELEK